METQGKNPPAAVRGFGPGGRIPRDSANEVVSPGGGYARQNSKSSRAEADGDSSTPTWRGGSRNGEDDEAVSFAVQRPVFF